MKKSTLFRITALILALLLCSGCAAGSSAPAEPAQGAPAADGEAYYDGVLTETADGAAPDPGEAMPENRKLITTVHMDAETRDMDALLAALDERIAQLGGYTQERSVNNGSSYNSYRRRSANLTVRIPADRLEEFIDHVENSANITSSNRSVEDVTLTYVDIESRIQALETEQQRLMELLAEAANMSDLLQIESRLTEVRYQLQSVESQLRSYDDLIDYSTVYLSISQVVELTQPEPETFWQRISSGLQGSFKDLGQFAVDAAVFLIVGLPYFALLGVLLFLVILLGKKRKKKKAAKKQNSES